jgi:hypothetical protein
MKKTIIHFILVAAVLLSGSLADAKLKCVQGRPIKKSELKQEASQYRSPGVMPQVLLFGV